MRLSLLEASECFQLNVSTRLILSAESSGK
jgi:hypothetical protein